MALLLTTPPTAEPAALADVKAHLRLTLTDDDSYILALITAARRTIESRYALALMPQSWTLFADAWPNDRVFHIPLWPVQSVLSLTVYADDDTYVTIDPSNFYLDIATRPARYALRQGRVFTQPGRGINGIKISFTAGFGADATAVPFEIKEGLMATIADWYQNRGDVAGGTLPATTIEALAAYKKHEACMMQPALDVQQAMKSTLASRPPLNTLLGGAYVYDELPRGATAPYVLFTIIETRDWSVADQKAHEDFVTLDVVSKSRSRAQAQNIVQEIELALDGAALTLIDNNLISLRCVFISAARQKSADYFSATMRFRAATEPK